MPLPFGVAQGALDSMDRTRKNAMDDALLAERKQRMQAEALAIENARAQQAQMLQDQQARASAGSAFHLPPPGPQGMPPGPPMGQMGSGAMPIPQGGPPPGPMGSGTMQPPMGGGPQGAPAMPPGMASQPQQAPTPQKPPIPPYQTVQSAQRPAQPQQAPQGPPPMPQQGQPQGGGAPPGQAQPPSPSKPQSVVDQIIKQMDAKGIPDEQRAAYYDQARHLVEDRFKEHVQTLTQEKNEMAALLKVEQAKSKAAEDALKDARANKREDRADRREERADRRMGQFDRALADREAKSAGGGATQKGWKEFRDADGTIYRDNANAGITQKKVDGKWQDADSLPEGASPLGSKSSAANATRQGIVKAGVTNSLNRLDEIDKKFGDKVTTSSFFGTHGENPVTRLVYGAGKSLQGKQQQEADADWASLIDESIPVFTGGLRGSDSFRRFLIEQAPGLGDKPEVVKEKKRLFRENINGTNRAFFSKFKSSPGMWAEGVKPEEVQDAGAAPAGKSGGWKVERAD